MANSAAFVLLHARIYSAFHLHRKEDQMGQRIQEKIVKTALPASLQNLSA